MICHSFSGYWYQILKRIVIGMIHYPLLSVGIYTENIVIASIIYRKSRYRKHLCSKCDYRCDLSQKLLLLVLLSIENPVVCSIFHRQTCYRIYLLHILQLSMSFNKDKSFVRRNFLENRLLSILFLKGNLFIVGILDKKIMLSIQFAVAHFVIGSRL